jgi:hypothetical protein
MIGQNRAKQVITAVITLRELSLNVQKCILIRNEVAQWLKKTVLILFDKFYAFY